MSGTWGNSIKFSIFGESHGSAVGIVIDGLPSGFKIDIDKVKSEMQRRAPGRNEYSTKRKETDKFEILSGYVNEKTTGTPFCAIIRNEDQKSQDYEGLNITIRPGHADFTGHIKYKGFEDIRGGGHFSGRLTAPIVLAGAICRQLLSQKGISIGSHIVRIGNITDDIWNGINISDEMLQSLNKMEVPVSDPEKQSLMTEEILKAKQALDSVGGIIETAIINLQSGMGDPFFDSVESRLSHVLFSIPAVKGVEFGAGFAISEMRGSQANDCYYIDENKNIRTYTNNNGGILGGITNGMPVVFRTAFKPTPSIGMEQDTVDLAKMQNTKLKIKGRHDPCIVLRAVPVVESAAAIVIADLLCESGNVF